MEGEGNYIRIEIYNKGKRMEIEYEFEDEPITEKILEDICNIAKSHVVSSNEEAILDDAKKIIEELKKLEEFKKEVEKDLEDKQYGKGIQPIYIHWSFPIVPAEVYATDKADDDNDENDEDDKKINGHLS